MNRTTLGNAALLGLVASMINAGIITLPASLGAQETSARIDSLRTQRDQLKRTLKAINAELDRLEQVETQESPVEPIRVRLKSDAPFYMEPGRSQIQRLREGTIVEALDVQGSYWQVKHGRYTGFVLRLNIDADAPLQRKVRMRARAAKQKEVDAIHAEREQASAFLASLHQKAREIASTKRWIAVQTANVRASPSDNASIVRTLNMDHPVYVQIEDGDWLQVAYSGPFSRGINPDDYSDIEDYVSSYSYGWIHKSLVSSQTPIHRSVEKSLSEVHERRRRFVDSNPNLSATNRNAILQGNIALGMTKAMVEASIGRPLDVNRSVGSWGVHEQWIYPDLYVYFENNKLSSWQD